jgi:asparagine synthase (glutamine-hydrolysing)
MCGIAGAATLHGEPLPTLTRDLDVMSDLIAHRGPDGSGTWRDRSARVGFAHRRLAIIDLETGAQPMRGRSGAVITYNGEIYNYVELRDELGAGTFETTSDTEVILRAYEAWGADCVSHLRGMFAFAIWDEQRGVLFCARDRFGIKPFHWSVVDGVFRFASEAKALLPFLPSIETDTEALKDYLAFQVCLGGKTLFKGVSELPAGHVLEIRAGSVNVRRYWDVVFEPDLEHTSAYFERRLRDAIEDSIAVHLRADVPVGAYLSGGLDSSAIAGLASERVPGRMTAFTGRFGEAGYDESDYARLVARDRGLDLTVHTITVDDFIDHVEPLVYHLDAPVAGPGALAQYEISAVAAGSRKVVLGGQGGDELFGGYTRYLIAYLEQCLKGAIDGTMHNGQFIVSYESILPNLVALRNYKSLLQEFWSDGLFEDMDRRYFRLVNRSRTIREEVRWDLLGEYSPWESFRDIFHAPNVHGSSYFDRMTHFDFKALLPGLLQVEDRVSMAHGLESRLPFLDHELVALAATMPANIKFEGGRMKRALLTAVGDAVPREIVERTDKMGFPTPFNEWAQGPARDYVLDVMTSTRALQRDIFDNRKAIEWSRAEGAFGRNFWGLFCLELWQRRFHDRAAEFRGLLEREAVAA